MAEQILPEMQDITRQRDLAKMLLQRGMTDNLQGQMVSGRYVGASPLQGIANMYSAYKGKQLAEESDRKQAELAQMLRQQTMKDLQAYGEAVTPRAGVQAQPEVIPQGQTMLDDQGVPTIGYKAPVEAVPEKKADYNKGLGILMSSKSPQSQALAQALLADQLKTIIVPEGGTVIRGGLGGAGETIKGDPKTTTDYKNYQAAVDGGYKGSFNDWFMQKQRASGVNVSVNTAKDLTGQVGDIGKASKLSAEGAVATADSANRIIQAVDSNQLFTGAGANQRLTVAQIADGLGLGGENTTQKIANTRTALQGLAQLTLQGRQQMRGQGAITESESALAQRAMSGDITLTAGEIRQLAEAAKRSAKFTYGQHQNIINAINADPTTKGLVPFYDVPADVSIFNPRAVGAQSNLRNEADAILGGSKR